MAGISIIPEVRTDRILPAYFFHGEDLYPARRFLRDLRLALTGTETEPVRVETFSLDVVGWRDILDVAKSLPFFFSPWRILAVEAKGGGRENLSSAAAAAFRDYFAAPASRTTIMVFFEGKIGKTMPLAKAFAALPKSAAVVLEFKPLKDKDLAPWVKERFEALGKRANSEAVGRLLDITGGDVGRIDSEIEKIITYIGPKKTVEPDDVSALSSEKNFLFWELTEALEQGARDKALVILHSFLADGTSPLLILVYLSGFVRDLLSAKAGLRVRRDRKEIFRELKPQISEKYGDFYQRKFNEYFSLVDRIPEADIRRWLEELERIDLRLKSTDISPQAMFEAFVIGYASRAAGSRITSPRRP